VKVEASKFTSRLRRAGRGLDRARPRRRAIRLVKEERRGRVLDRAAAAAEEKLVELLASAQAAEAAGGVLEGGTGSAGI